MASGWIWRRSSATSRHRSPEAPQRQRESSGVVRARGVRFTLKSPQSWHHDSGLKPVVPALAMWGLWTAGWLVSACLIHALALRRFSRPLLRDWLLLSAWAHLPVWVMTPFAAVGPKAAALALVGWPLDRIAGHLSVCYGERYYVEGGKLYRASKLPPYQRLPAKAQPRRYSRPEPESGPVP